MKQKICKKIALFMAVIMVFCTIQITGGTDMESVSAGESTKTELTDITEISAMVNKDIPNRATVHDPSIVTDGSDYYVFGSHMAWAKSTNLIDWSMVTSNINTDYSTIFGTFWDNWTKYDSSGNATSNLDGNLWAPDVIYNKATDKWYMYMSVNGPNYNSVIVRVEGPSINGPWSNAEPVVYSGFTNKTGVSGHNHSFTDYSAVTGDSTVNSRYLSGTSWNSSYGMNAIDPCVVYDENDDLWMVYGSWFGGIYILKLDNETGLRDRTKTYSTTTNQSDAYFGTKLAGGYSVSGEGPYIQKIGDYYFLFLSYGGLDEKGGYNIRVFRSANVDGPYVDASGKSAIFTSNSNNINGTTGMKIMSNYKWSFMDLGYVAQGHNSALVDKDDKAYLMYHTRFDNNTEWHAIRTHQLFTNEDGWIVAAPFEYRGETISPTGYAKDEILGTYEGLYHKLSIDYANLECATAQNITFNADGTISGDYTGTWTTTDNTPYVTITIGGVAYKGVFVEQTMEESNVKTMTFSVVGSNNTCIWGAKNPDAEIVIAWTASELSIPQSVSSNLTLPTSGLFGSEILWSSNSGLVLSDGTVITPKTDTSIVIKATISNGDYYYEKEFPITVFSDKSEATEPWKLASYYTDEVLDLTKGTSSMQNPLLGVDISNGVIIKFDAKLTGTHEALSNIISFNDNSGGKLYFAGASYLGYNATGGWYDANLRDYATVNDYIGKNVSTAVEIRVLPSGYEVWINGDKKYDYASVSNGTVAGTNALNDHAAVLSFLSSSALTLNFGFGNWWDNPFQGTISNLEFYIEPIPESRYIYKQNYETVINSLAVWTSTNAQSTLTVASDTDHGNYISFNSGSTSGNRGAYSNFPAIAQLTGEYIVDVDVSLSASNYTSPVNQFVIKGMDMAYTSSNINNGIASGYILKLEAANSTSWTINGNSATKVTLPRDWVHIKAKVNTESKTADIVISDESTTYYTGTVTINGTGQLGGLYMLAGRRATSGSGEIKVDNIGVSLIDGADYIAYTKALDKAKAIIKLYNQYPIYDETSIELLETAIAQAEALGMNLGEEMQNDVDVVTAALQSAISNLVVKTYTISVDSTIGGTVSGLNANGEYLGGEAVTLTAEPDNGYVIIGWKDEDENMVSRKEVFTFMASDDTTLTPMFESRIPVDSIILNKTSATLILGDTLQLTAAVLPENARDREVEWTSSNAEVATVDEDGLVTTIGVGTANITATAKDGSGESATAVIEVWLGLVDSITLDKTSATLIIGDTLQLTAAVLPENARDREVEWTSSNAEVATVDEDGLVTTIGVGTANITATAKDGSGESATAVIEVWSGLVDSITLDKTSAALIIGDKLQLAATVLPENAINRNVEWTSSNPVVATVDASGNVTAVSVGTAIITVTAKDESGKSAAAEIKVLDSKPTIVKVTGVTLKNKTATVAINKTSQLTATVAPADAANKAVTWTSDKPGVAKVDGNGKVTGIKPGTATITVTTKDGSKTATCIVTVPYAKTSKVTVTTTGLASNQKVTNLYIVKGKKVTIKGAVSPATAKQGVKYSSKASSIASVTQKGVIKGKKVGKTKIYVKSKDGKKTVKITVHVVKAAKKVTKLTVKKSSLNLKVKQTYNLKSLVKVTPKSTTYKVTYKVEDKAYVTVSKDGKITAKKKGKTDITVKCGKKSVRVKVNVK